MKGRKRKQRSKSASNAEVLVDAEMGAGPSTALPGTGRQVYPIDEVVASVEVKEPGSDPIAPAAEHYVIDLGNELLAAVEQEKRASDSVKLAEADRHSHPGSGPSGAVAGADRRTPPRYKVHCRW